MSVERICGSIPMSASSTLLAEDVDMGDDDYDMEGEESSPSFPGPWQYKVPKTFSNFELLFSCVFLQVMWMMR